MGPRESHATSLLCEGLRKMGESARELRVKKLQFDKWKFGLNMKRFAGPLSFALSESLSLFLFFSRAFSLSISLLLFLSLSLSLTLSLSLSVSFSFSLGELFPWSCIMPRRLCPCHSRRTSGRRKKTHQSATAVYHAYAHVSLR